MKSIVFIHFDNMTFFYEDTLLDLISWWEEHVICSNYLQCPLQ